MRHFPFNLQGTQGQCLSPCFSVTKYFNLSSWTDNVQGSIPFPISYTRVLISSTLDDLCQGMVVSSFKYWLIDNMTHSYLEAIFFFKTAIIICCIKSPIFNLADKDKLIGRGWGCPQWADFVTASYFPFLPYKQVNVKTCRSTYIPEVK